MRLILERKLSVTIVRMIIDSVKKMLTPMHNGMNQLVYDIGNNSPFQYEMRHGVRLLTCDDVLRHLMIGQLYPNT